MATVTVQVDVDEVLGPARTDELIEELKRRNRWKVKDKLRSAEDLAPVLQSAMAGRNVTDEIREYISDQVGEYIVLAFEASLAGDKSLAVAHLDRAHQPTKAATATQNDLAQTATWAVKLHLNHGVNVDG